jgi:hypothetical protein
MIFVIDFTHCFKKTAEKLKDEKQMAQLTIEQAQKKHQDRIMALPGVVGVGIGAVKDTLVIKVLVSQKTAALEKKIPKTLEGYKVIIEETGEIRALQK